jgi:hypothetical protein
MNLQAYETPRLTRLHTVWLRNRKRLSCGVSARLQYKHYVHKRGGMKQAGGTDGEAALPVCSARAGNHVMCNVMTLH